MTEGAKQGPSEPKKRPVRKSTGRNRRGVPADDVELWVIPISDESFADVLCAGCLYVRNGDAIAAWRGRAPEAEIASAGGERSDGCTVLLEVELPPPTLPDSRSRRLLTRSVSLSRCRRVLFRTQRERDVFAARLRAFPDVPLDAVRYEVDPERFGGTPDELALGPEHAPDAKRMLVDGPQAMLADKLVGAIACAVHGIRSSGDWPSASLDSMVAAVGRTPRTAADFMTSLLIGLDSQADPAGASFVAHLARRLAAIDVAAGFEPEALLREVSSDAAAGLDHKSLAALKSFEKTAIEVLEATSTIGQSLLSDDGSIGLRAVLTFMRVQGRPEQLEALSRRGPGIGRRVAVVTWALIGLHHGCSALSVRFKATPFALLGVLGDVGAAVGHEDTEWLGTATRRGESGRPSKTLILAGRVEFPVGIESPVGYSRLYETAERQRWQFKSESENVEYLIAFPDEGEHLVVFEHLERSPVFPEREAIELAVNLELRVKKALPSALAMIEFERVSRDLGVCFRLRRIGLGWMPQFTALWSKQEMSGDGLETAARLLVQAKGRVVSQIK